MRARQEIALATAAVREAEARLDQAETPELVDAAVFELEAAEIRLDYLLRQVRQERGIVIERSKRKWEKLVQPGVDLRRQPSAVG